MPAVRRHVLRCRSQVWFTHCKQRNPSEERPQRYRRGGILSRMCAVFMRDIVPFSEDVYMNMEEIVTLV